MSYNFRDDAGLFGPQAAIEIPNGASAPAQYKMQLVEMCQYNGINVANISNTVIFTTPPAASVATGALPLGQYSLVEVSARWSANTGSNAATLQVVRVPSGTAVGSGTNLLATAINLQTTADTITTAFPSNPALVLTPGDSLGLLFTGTLTGLANIAVTTVVARVA